MSAKGEFKYAITELIKTYRLKRIINFYYKRGCNKESVNTVYKKILKARYETNT